MKKIVTICLFIATMFEMNAQSVSKFETFEGLSSLMDISFKKAESLIKENKYVLDEENGSEMNEDITFNTYNAIEEMRTITIGTKKGIVVMAMMNFTGEIYSDEDDIDAGNKFAYKINTFKNALLKANYKLSKEDNDVDGWETSFYSYKNKKIVVRKFKNDLADFIIYKEEIESIIINNE